MIKKIYSLLVLAVIAAGFVACSDDDDTGEQYLRKSQVSITSSNITFTAKADTGSVEFTAPTGATATVNRPWASAVVDGNRVRVSVDNNPNLEGRSALLTIKAGSDSANVTVQQQGMEYAYDDSTHVFIFTDSAQTFSVSLTNVGGNVVATPDSAVDWATPTVTENGVDIALSENNTGHIRRGLVYINDGAYADTILVMQGELQDIVNRYYLFAGYDLNLITENTQSLDEILSYMQGAIIMYQGQPIIYFPDYNYMLPIEFDQPTLSFNINAGEYMGMYYNYYYLYSSIIEYAWYTAFNQYGYNAYFAYPGIGLSMTGIIDYSDALGTYVQFTDNNTNDYMIYLVTQGSYTEYNANTFAITAFSQSWDTALANDRRPSYAGNLIMYYYPFMLEGQASSGSKAAVQQKAGALQASPRHHSQPMPLTTLQNFSKQSTNFVASPDRLINK